MASNTIPTKIADGIVLHRQAYLTTGGAKGHINLDVSGGGHHHSINLLLKFKGRKSGKAFVTPLSYGAIGGEFVIIASKGGADEHPNWYLNLREDPAVEFQIATQAFRGTWREPQGAEREKVWAYMVDCYPFYAAYQTRTSRLIPVVLLRPEQEIPVFKESDFDG
jgi:deazaflavin-dependent oxidoreductase (nitroreductase family)